MAAVTSDKGHDVLLQALATISDLSWHCVCVGSLDRDPAFVDGLRRRSADGGLDDRVSFPGPRTGAALDRSYAAADLLVLASRAETYGMVVTEALARGVPAVAADIGGLSEALGHGSGRDPAGAAGGARGPLGTRRRAPGVARRRRAASAAAPGRARAARDAARVVGHRVGGGRCPGRGVAVSSEIIRVSPDWLALREPADAAARARDLAERLGGQPPATGRWVIHDLGGGTGAMGRWLAPLLPGPQHWVVHDRDADLLAVAAADLPGPAADGAAVTVEARCSDITRLGPGDLAGATLDHRLSAAGPADRDGPGRTGHRLRRRRVPGPADAVGRRSRPTGPGGSSGRPRGRRLRCPPTPPDAAGPPPRTGRRRAGRGGVQPRGSRGPRPAQPLAARPRPGRPGGGVVDRVGGRRARAAAGAGRRRPTPMRAGVWRRRRPESSPSPSTTPTCSSCPGDRPPQPADSGMSSVCAPRRAFVAR